MSNVPALQSDPSSQRCVVVATASAECDTVHQLLPVGAEVEPILDR